MRKGVRNDIHCQPLSPLLPLRSVKTYAKIAEKPPVRTERIQNPARRLPTSKRVYQQVIKYVHPGRNPASNTPNNARHSAIVPQDSVNAIPMSIAPKLTPRKASQLAGPAFGRTRFFGV